MRSENTKATNDAIIYGKIEEPVVKFLENQFKCLEEEYNIEIFSRGIGDRPESQMRQLGIDYEGIVPERKNEIDQVMESLIPALLSYGQQQYIEQQLAKRKAGTKDDPLTGVFNSEYLKNRAEVLKRAEIFPTKIIAVKLQGWKNVRENHGKESGDSFVQLVASILGKAADKDYLIGRMKEDVFVILIPLVREGEAEDYCQQIKESCNAYEDSILAPNLEIAVTATVTKEDDVNEKIEEAMNLL